MRRKKVINCLSKKIFIKGVATIFVVLLLLFNFVSVKADVIMEGNKNFPSYSFPEIYNDKQNIHNLNLLLEDSKNEGYNILICSGDIYSSAYYQNLKPYWILISNEPLNYDGVNFYTSNSSTCKYFSCSLIVSDTDNYSDVNNLSDPNFQFRTNFSSHISKQYYPTVVYYDFPGGLDIVNNVDTSFFPEPLIEYDKNDLKTYPIDTINITSPLEGDIKTNNSYFDITVKGKIRIDFSKSLLGNSLFPMTPEMIGKYIRRDFRYSVDGDVEDENNLSYLGLGNKGFGNYFIEYLNQFYQDISLNVDKNRVGDVNTFWTIGVTGNMNDWSNKHYYNFILQTRLWCGYLNKDLKYNLSFTVPVAFDGGLTNVDPSEYKSISINNYSLSRDFYVDDDFDGVDDTNFEVIPDDEIEIIHPGFFPSTSTPSNNNYNDGDVVQNNNNIINVDNGSEISAEEKNGILNMLDNGVRKTTTLLNNLKNSMTNLGNTLQGLFDLLPEPISYLFYSALCLSLIFFILSLRR